MTESTRSVPVSGILGSIANDVSHGDALLPGTRLAEFEILALLGVGGFGMVYKAFDHSLHRAVAIKEYMPSAMAGRAQEQSLWVRSASDQSAFRAGLASFVDEARLLAQFDHPSLVKVFRFWEANNTAYMVMPLYSGMTLKQARTHMRTPPPEPWLRKLLWSVLGALRVLHDGRTLHRDISPDNIFLQFNGPPVLLDLGAARHAINDQDRHHTAVLKVNYAPIEQYAEGDDELRQGPWSDLYSLAAVVHGCLCNDTPLPATLRSIRDRMVPFSRVAKTVKRQFGVEYSAPFVAAVSQSLALRPQDRPQTIEAFLEVIEMTAPPDGVQYFDFRADLGDIWVAPSDPPDIDLTTPTVVVRPALGGDAPARVLAMGAQGGPAGATAESGASGAGDAGEADTIMLDGPDTVVPYPPGDTVFLEPGDSIAPIDAHDDLRDGHGLADARGVPLRAAAFDAERPTGPRGAGKAATNGARRSLVPVWLGVAVFAVVVSAAGYRWTQSHQPVPDGIITELAEHPTAKAVAMPGEPPSGAPAQATEVTSPESGPAPAFVVASPAPAPATAASRAAARTPKRPAPELGSLPAPQLEPVAPPEPVPVAVVESRPRAAPVVPTPQEACASSNFLARPLCIHQECQKPSQAGRSICVEARQRYEADELRRRQTPN